MYGRNVVSASIIGASVFLIVSLLSLSGSLDGIENFTFDSAQRILRSGKKVSGRIAVILIDEASLHALDPVVGRWPWPRAIYSDLLEFLSFGKPEAIVFDILFTERQKSARRDSLGEDDAALVQATVRSGVVYHSMQLVKDEEDEVNKSLLNRPLPEDVVTAFSLKNIKGKAGDGARNNYYLPFPELYRASRGLGDVEISPEIDGMYRTTSLIRGYRQGYYPVMGLAPLIGDRPIEMGDGWLNIGDRSVPLDRDGHYVFNHYGLFNAYSISGIFASLQKMRSGEIENIMVDPAAFRDKIVFVGASASGIEDLKLTPIAPRTPGVYLHATIASNLLQDDFLVPVTTATTLLLTILSIALCVSAAFFLKRHSLKILFPFIIAAGWLLFYFIALKRNALFEFAPPFAASFLSSVASMGSLLFTEGKEKLKIRRMFSQYVSPEILAELADQRGGLARASVGSRVDVTVLFTDIRGFTAYSDKIPPEQVVTMLNCYFTRMTDVIFRHRGTIDKFIGDAIMAFWGAPVEMDNHPEQAVLTAIDMMRNLASVNEELKRSQIDFHMMIGVGINSGAAVLGNIGSEKKLNYTMIGDTVNLSSRLESMTKTYGCPILLSEFTYARLPKSLPCRIVDHVQVRGKEDTIKIYEALIFDDDVSLKRAQQLCRVTNEAYELYVSENYGDALRLYSSIEDGTLKDTFVRKLTEILEPSGR